MHCRLEATQPRSVPDSDIAQLCEWGRMILMLPPVRNVFHAPYWSLLFFCPRRLRTCLAGRFPQSKYIARHRRESVGRLVGCKFSRPGEVFSVQDQGPSNGLHQREIERLQHSCWSDRSCLILAVGENRSDGRSSRRNPLHLGNHLDLCRGHALTGRTSGKVNAMCTAWKSRASQSKRVDSTAVRASPLSALRPVTIPIKVSCTGRTTELYPPGVRRFQNPQNFSRFESTRG